MPSNELALDGFHLALRILDRLGVRYDASAVFAKLRDLAALGELAAVDDEDDAAEEMETADRIVAGQVWRAMNHGKKSTE